MNSKPLEIPIEVTLKCNYTCTHCFNKNVSKVSQELDTLSIIKILNKIADVGIEAVRFTGGEPLLRKDIVTLIKHAKSKGLYTILNTNGILLNENRIEELKDILDDILIPINTLNDYEEKIFSGQDYSFSKKIDVLKILKRNGIKSVRSCTIVTKDNFKKIDEIIKLVKSLKLDHWGVLRPLPNKNDLFPISNNIIEIVVEKLISYNGKYKFINSIPFCSYNPQKVKKVSVGSRFDDCSIRITVGSDGKAKPNYYMDEDLGNVLEKDIMECWNHEFVKKLRNFELIDEICKDCRYLNICGGGMRFTAYLVNGSYFSLDPLAKPEKYKGILF